MPILQKLINVKANVLHLTTNDQIDELNMTAAIAIGFGGFLRLGEFTYKAKDLLNLRTFEHTSLLRSNVTFSDTNDYVTIALKRSKTDYDHKGVAIVVAASRTLTCLVHILRRLFAEDP